MEAAMLFALPVATVLARHAVARKVRGAGRA
jgi:hypothetical protein